MLSNKPNRTPEEQAELDRWLRSCPEQVQSRISRASTRSLLTVRTGDTSLTALGSAEIESLMHAMQGHWRNYGTLVVLFVMHTNFAAPTVTNRNQTVLSDQTVGPPSHTINNGNTSRAPNSAPDFPSANHKERSSSIKTINRKGRVSKAARR